jgi:hypothetical protein
MTKFLDATNNNTTADEPVRLINLTPHTINLQVGGRTPAFRLPPVVLPSEGLARVAVTAKHEGSLIVTAPSEVAGGGLSVFREEYGEVTGLPEPSHGTYYIVSAVVRAACPERKDLLSPGHLVRDGEGRVVGCEGFVCN